MSHSLLAKCQALNAAHALIREHIPKILTALQPWLGQDVLKQDGTFLEKVRKTLPPDPRLAAVPLPPPPGNAHIHRAQFEFSRYSLLYHVSGCVNFNGIGHYMDAHTVYLGNFTGAKLEKLYDFTPEDWRTDWHPGEVLATRNEVTRLERELSSKRNQLHNFGMYES